MIKNILDTYSPKVIRGFVIALCFICVVTIQGIQEREAQQIVMSIGITVVFGLLLRNIWLTLFLWWTTFLFCFFKFSGGHIYIQNVFYGCLLYYLTKISFKKQNIDSFMTALVVLGIANCVYAILQTLNLDFMYMHKVLDQRGFFYSENTQPNGFMGHKSIIGYLCALVAPIAITRRSKWAKFSVLLLIFPLYMSKASICVVGLVIGLVFVSYFKLSRKLFITIVLSLVVLGGSYLKWVDRPSISRIYLWRDVLKKCVQHPITGHGLDSFRKQNIVGRKYSKGEYSVQQRYKYDCVWTWDNPHNLYVSLFFEWGIFSLVFLFMYVFALFKKFKYSLKSNNTVGLAAFVVVLLFISIAHFPMFLARTACFIIPAFAIFEVSMKKETYA